MRLPLTLGAIAAIMMLTATSAQATVHVEEDSTCYDVGAHQLEDCWYFAIGWQDDPDGVGIKVGWDVSQPGVCGEYESTKAHIVRLTLRDPSEKLRLAHYDFPQNVCSRQEDFPDIEINGNGCTDAYLVVEPKVDNFFDPGTKTLHDRVCVFA